MTESNELVRIREVVDTQIVYEDTFEKEVATVEYFYFGRGFSDMPLHIHRHVETQFIFQGTGSFHVDGSDYRCTDGLLLIFPYQPHSNAAVPDCRQYSAIINPNSFPAYASTFFDFYPKHSFIPRGDLPRGFSELMEYGCALSRNEADCRFRERLLTDITSVLIGEALSAVELVSRRDETSAASISLIGRIIHYCVTHLSEDLSLAAIADRFYVNRSYVSRLFAKKLGCSYGDFITAQRLSAACEQLSQSAKPITEIAYDCGFHNQSSFNRIFLAKHGITPSEYRKTQK